MYREAALASPVPAGAPRAPHAGAGIPRCELLLQGALWAAVPVPAGAGAVSCPWLCCWDHWEVEKPAGTPPPFARCDCAPSKGAAVVGCAVQAPIVHADTVCA